MKRLLVIVALLFGLATGVAAAQTRVGVSFVFVGRPYYHRYWYPYYYRYYREPVILVGPRFYRARRFHARRYYWGRHW